MKRIDNLCCVQSINHVWKHELIFSCAHKNELENLSEFKSFLSMNCHGQSLT